MAKTTKRAGKRATAAGRSKPPAHKSAAPKSPASGSRKPNSAKPKPARSTPRKPKPTSASGTAGLKVQLKAAQSRQRATAEVLQVISRSPGELGPVFRAVLENATRLCNARFGTVHRFDGKAFYFVADVGTPQALAEYMRRPGPLQIPAGGMLDRIQTTRQMQHTPDYAADAVPGLGARLGGARSTLGVPILRDNVLVGAIVIYRQEVRPFSEREIDLVRSFAAQAAIAIENARLFNEVQTKTRDLEESLHQQTATADVLKTISRSTFDLQVVLDTLTESAARLCEADMASMNRQHPDGDGYYNTNMFNFSPDWINLTGSIRLRPGRGTAVGRALLTGKATHITDVLADPEYTFPEYQRYQQTSGFRTVLAVPLMRAGAPIGVIFLVRKVVKPFTEKQIELLTTFADQAVIAIENARLFNETQEALERQTATSEVLQVISSSPGDLKPVFDQMLAQAMRLCEAQCGFIYQIEQGAMRAVAEIGVPPAFAEYRRNNLHTGGAATPADVMRATRKPAHVHDARDSEPYRTGNPNAVAGVDLGGARTVLYVPMIRNDEIVGVINVYRKEVRPFTEQQISLLENFASQAVIAIENARLFNETKEALERQTATSEILRVISQSPTDVKPVFEAIAQTAVRLLGCDRAFIQRCDGKSFWTAAWCGPEGQLPILNAAPAPIDPTANFPSRAIVEQKTLHLPDWSTIELPEFERTVHDRLGIRSALYLPLLRDGECIGLLGMAGKRANAFGAKDIVLAEAFRDQAVIAIENARLFNETKEALERQTATAAILQVIAGSPSDVQPVFEAVAERAMSLLDCWSVIVLRFDGEFLHFGAARGARPDTEHVVRERYRSLRPDRADLIGRSLLDGNIVNCADAQAEPEMEIQDYARKRGLRAVLVVPLRREDRVDGVLVLTRAEPGLFAAREVELVQTFADQAVIAIQNARLFNETKEALERQTATSDILKVIASSPSDVQPVFEAIASSAKRLIGGFSTAVHLVIDDMVHLVAFTPTNPESDKILVAAHPRPRSEVAAVALVENGETAQIADSETADAHTRQLGRARGWRSVTLTPLMNQGTLIGFIASTRRETGVLAEHQVQLLRTFADQAAIAIQNARLFNETKEALEQQTATSDILAAINNSGGFLAPVFECILEKAHQLCGAPCGSLQLYQDDRVQPVAIRGMTRAFAEFLERGYPITEGVRSGLFADHPVQRVDMVETLRDQPGEPSLRAAVELGGIRTMASVPLLKDGVAFGRIIAARQEVRPFDDKQLATLQGFAAQAVIAIENARLLNELRARTDDLSESLEQQTATADVLKVISRSAFDLDSVLETLVTSATKLCEAEQGCIFIRDDDCYRLAQNYGCSPEFEAFAKANPLPVGGGSTTARAGSSGGSIQVVDVLADESRSELVREYSRLGNVRTLLSVTLRREGETIGVFTLSRREVRAFSQRQIDLVETFADQAVIALENTRLFSETQEALERQTATADILKVIASSPSDAQPVFQAIADRSNRLVDALSTTVFRLVDGVLHLRAFTATTPEADAKLQALFPAPLSTLSWGEAIAKAEIYRVIDAEQESERLRDVARERGWRSALLVPLLRDGKPIGIIGPTRAEPGPFSEHHVQLMQTFADQAVIAIQNVELFEKVQAKTRDLEESLQQQTATADVLKVIGRSAFDLNQVFETVVESSVRLCGADRAIIFRFDGEVLRVAHVYNAPEQLRLWLEQNPIRPGRHSVAARAALERRTVQVEDVRADREHTYAAKEIEPFRTVLGVPMLKADHLLGVILVYHNVVKPFTDKQILLVSTFAEQAAIAIENVRLFDEVQTRTRELAKSLEDLRTAQDRLIQTEKLASLGQLTAGIAHEIKNPLNFVNNFSSLSTDLIGELNDALKAAPLDDKTRNEIGELTAMLKGNLEKVVQHGKRADSIVKNMLLHSREGAGEHRAADINAIVEESLNLAFHGARAEKSGFNITLSRDLDPAAGVIELYPQEITRVLLNLISNGFYAATKRNETGDDGFEPSLRATTKNLGNRVEIRIRDNGTGIPAEVKEKMFNPFFTTKPAGEGTGLGLSMSHDIIVKQHGGRIEVDTEPGQFTEFIITLPRAAAKAQPGERK